MRKLLFLLLLVSGVASAQYTPTGSKTRFVNGIGLGTKSDAAFGTVDSLVLYAKTDANLMFKYKGTARAVGYAANAVAWGNSLTYGTGASVLDSNYTNDFARYTGWVMINKGVPGETSTQIKDRVLAASADTLNMAQIFWMGENDGDTAVIHANINAVVNKIAHKRYLIVGTVLRSTNPIGNAFYDAVTKMNADLAKQYGDHFMDLRTWLLNFGDGSSQDNTDIANGVTPRSLRDDIIHFNDKGYRVVAQRFIQNLNVLIGGDNFNANSISVASQSGTPILNGNGLFLWKNIGHSYISSYSATTPYVGGDTLDVQFQNGVLNLLPNSGSLRTGFLPFLGTGTKILTRGAGSDSAQISYVASGQIASASGDITVTDGANSTVNKNVDLALTVVNSSPGTYGDSVTVPQIVVDSKGRVTAAINKTIPTASSSIKGLLSSTDWSTFNSKQAGATEGDFTASLVPSGGSLTMGSNTMHYYKIGKQVTVTGYLDVSAVSSPSGSLTIINIPFASGTGTKYYAPCTIYANGLASSATTTLMGYIGSASTTITLFKYSAGSLSNVASDVQAGTQFMIQLTYFTN